MSIPWKLLSRHSDPECCWFRVYGYGLAIKSSPPIFSERVGKQKAWKIPWTKWRVLVLNRGGVWG